MRSLTLGPLTVQKVVELERWAHPISSLFPAVPSEVWDEARRTYDERFIDPLSGHAILAVHTYVVRVGGRVILVDSCNGNHKRRSAMPFIDGLETPYLARLAAIGVRPEDVDVVLCTHLHPDHVGWNTRLRDGSWVPTFPNARYLLGRTDYDDLLRLVSEGPSEPPERDVIQAYEDSVRPIVEHGQVLFVEDGHTVARELDHGVWVESASGHTPGHVAVRLEGGGKRAVATGDAFHHLFQLAAPDYPQAADRDPEQAALTRRRLFEASVEKGTILLPGHVPFPTAGRVVERAGRFGFDWVGA